MVQKVYLCEQSNVTLEHNISTLTKYISSQVSILGLLRYYSLNSIIVMIRIIIFVCKFYNLLTRDTRITDWLSLLLNYTRCPIKMTPYSFFVNLSAMAEDFKRISALLLLSRHSVAFGVILSLLLFFCTVEDISTQDGAIGVKFWLRVEQTSWTGTR